MSIYRRIDGHRPGAALRASRAFPERGESFVSAERTEGPRPADTIIVHGERLTESTLALHDFVSRNVPDRNDTLLHASGALVTATSGPRNHMPLLPDCTSSLQVSPAGSSRGSPASAGSELAPGEIAIGDLLELAGVGLGAGVILEHPTDEDFFRDLDDTLDE
ncbi:hypothetical protein BN1708_013409 [Verticillium longisporum]|uniref:Uncharacterized protein n=1 Tax=Verticillium longisporum TaxID=100787 RepID=A0A0G4LKD0_VERLO|nr:hypothetical protein BN1708_013409 [Verticillium longisporum]